MSVLWHSQVDQTTGDYVPYFSTNSVWVLLRLLLINNRVVGDKAKGFRSPLNDAIILITASIISPVI